MFLSVGWKGAQHVKTLALTTDSLSPVAVTHGQRTELILASCPLTPINARLPLKTINR